MVHSGSGRFFTQRVEMRRLIRVVGLLCCLCGLGCSTAPIAVVTGRVAYRGEPVKAGAVEISSEANGVTYVTDLTEDGSFVFQFRSGQVPSPGRYRVAVKPPRGNKPSLEYQPLKEVRPEDYPNIPKRFHDSATSKLNIDIFASKGTHCQFDLD